MAFCSDCGNQLAVDAQLCSRCGAAAMSAIAPASDVLEHGTPPGSKPMLTTGRAPGDAVPVDAAHDVVLAEQVVIRRRPSGSARAGQSDALASVPASARRSKRGLIVAVVIGMVVVLGGVGSYLAIGRRPHKEGLASCLIGQWQVTKEENLSNGQWQPRPGGDPDDLLHGLMTFAADGTVSISAAGYVGHGIYAIEGDTFTTDLTSAPVSITATCSAETLIMISDGTSRTTLTRMP